MDVRLSSPYVRPSPVGKRAQAKEQNRRIILDAARKVFAELGYARTNVRDIIRATHLASGTFYNYFRSKEEIFETIWDEVAQAARPAFREDRRQAQTAEAFVSATFRSFFRTFVANRGELTAIGWNRANVWRHAPDMIAGVDELREDIELAVMRGLFPALNAEWLAAAMFGVAFELAECLHPGDVSNCDDIAEFATALFNGGMGACQVQSQ